MQIKSGPQRAVSLRREPDPVWDQVLRINRASVLASGSPWHSPGAGLIADGTEPAAARVLYVRTNDAKPASQLDRQRRSRRTSGYACAGVSSSGSEEPCKYLSK